MGAYIVKFAKKVLNRDNVILSAVDDMLDSPFNAQLQQQKCDVLHGLVALERNRFQPAKARLHQMKIGEAGGVECVILVLKNHNNELALRAACRLLGELARDEGNSERMRLADIDPILDKCAKDNYDDEYIVADIDKTRENMVRAGAHLEHQHIAISMEKKDVAPIVRALVNQPANVDVQLEALDALWNLCKDPALSRSVMDNNGLKAIVTSCTAHSKNVLVVRKGYGLLAVLAKDVENSNILGKSGAIGALLLAFKNFPDDFKLQQQAIWALNTLSKYDMNMTRLTDQGCGSILRYCMRAATEKEIDIVIPVRLKRLVKKAELEADSDEEDGSGSEDEEEGAAKSVNPPPAVIKPPPKKAGPPQPSWKTKHAGY